MLDSQFFPWCDSASPTSPLPWRELQPRLPLPWREGRGEGETHTPGIVKLWESPGRAEGLPMINQVQGTRHKVHVKTRNQKGCFPCAVCLAPYTFLMLHCSDFMSGYPMMGSLH